MMKISKEENQEGDIQEGERILSFAEMQRAFDSTPALIYLSDNQTKTIRWCNRYMEEITGYSLKEMQQMGIEFFRTIMHPEGFPKALEARERFKQGKEVYTGFCRIRPKWSREWIWLYGSAVPYSYDKRDRVKEVICNFQVFKEMDTPVQMHRAFHAILQAELEHALQTLSPREREIFDQMATGNKNKELAKKLFISEDTLKSHKKKITKKLGNTNLRLLVNLAAFCSEGIVK